MQTIFDCCMNQARAAFRDVKEMYRVFVRELGGELPAKFTLDIPAMRELEDGIEKAVELGDLQETEDLSDKYRERFAAYLNAWRKIVAKGAVV